MFFARFESYSANQHIVAAQILTWVDAPSMRKKPTTRIKPPDVTDAGRKEKRKEKRRETGASLVDLKIK